MDARESQSFAAPHHCRETVLSAMPDQTPLEDDASMNAEPLPAQKALRRLMILGAAIILVCIAILSFAWSGNRKTRDLPLATGSAHASPAAKMTGISLAQFSTMSSAEAGAKSEWEAYTPPDAAVAMNAARSLVSDYWEARTWQEKLKLVRKPDRVEALMRDFYEQRSGHDRRGANLLNYRFQRTGAVEGLNMIFSDESGSSAQPVTINLVRQANGKWLLDWESSVGSGSLKPE